MMIRKFRISILLVVSIGCKNKNPAENHDLYNDTSYTSLAYVCFTQQNEPRRVETFKLGDSVNKVLEFLDLDTNAGNIYPLKKPIIETGKHGTCTITANAYFKYQRLNKFEAYWEYTCDTTREARSEFHSFITNHAMRCFWEDGPNIFKALDTLQSAFIDNREYRLITDLRTNPWKAHFIFQKKR